MNKKTIIPFAVIVAILVVSSIVFAVSRSKSDKMPNEDMNKSSATMTSSPTQAAQAQEPNTVIMQNFEFSPKELKIKKGTTITWINKDDARHNVVTTNNDEVKAKLFGQNEKFEFTFNNVGEFDYKCEPHPYMKGKIIVTE